MADPFIGEVRIFAFGFAPDGWARCDGSALARSQNSALFAILGTAYGAPSDITFGLPNLEGRTAIGAGQGPGLSNRTRGDQGGEATVTLTEQQLPAHTHRLRANVTDPGDINAPSSSSRLAVSTGGTLYQASSDGTMANTALGFTGGSMPHDNMAPSLRVNFCISLSGTYPTQ